MTAATTRPVRPSPTQLLARCRIGRNELFAIGPLDTGVTVLSQQIRALNLVWALVERGDLATETAAGRQRVAIVGGGFAGLTAAAAMVHKGVVADVTVFEKRDTAAPLQLGSDTRWIHPHIYDWPAPGSEAFSASLPLLNWTAGRASDVVVQIMQEWQLAARAAQDSPEFTRLSFFCNTQHLQVSRSLPDAAIRIEWVGEPRDPGDPSVPDPSRGPGGHSELFDTVILATGFGLEESSPSYWRNEQLAQPQLGQASITYVVSGAGDGALIDLFRLRIARFRQDRILSELFRDHEDLFRSLRRLESEMRDEPASPFQRLDATWADPGLAPSTSAVRQALTDRLRRDNRVILHVQKGRKLAELFNPGRVSFQNRLLLFLLYKVGGFHPSTDDLDQITREHQVRPEHIIRRHGLKAGEPIRAALGSEFHKTLDRMLTSPEKHQQPDEPLWEGGYFSYYASRASDPDPTLRAHWRKEYLPGPTEAIATAFCAGLAGYLASTHPRRSRLRVTLHRVLRLGSETLLQQCCEYQGVQLGQEPGQSAGRTFPASNGTIGLALTRRRIVRSADQALAADIQGAMTKVALNEASREMSGRVRSVLALPLLGSDSDGRETVVGVLYADSYEGDYFSDATRTRTVVNMSTRFLESLSHLSGARSGHLANNNFWLGRTEPRSIRKRPVPAKMTEEQIEPSRTPGLAYINFDFCDFVGVDRS